MSTWLDTTLGTIVKTAQGGIIVEYGKNDVSNETFYGT